MVLLPDQLAGICRLHAKDVQLVPGRDVARLDRAALLWGFAGVESTWGKNGVPRHEAGYCRGGKYFDPSPTARWGCWAHCSYGPWQVMFANFPNGVTPWQLNPAGDGAVAAELCIRAAIVRINRSAQTAQTLGDLARGYNGPESTEQYAAELARCYAEPMPAATILSGGY